jgi:hypothetical protein
MALFVLWQTELIVWFGGHLDHEMGAKLPLDLSFDPLNVLGSQRATSEFNRLSWSLPGP